MLSVLGKLGGRKFIVAVFGAIAVAANSWLGISEASVTMLGTVVSAYLVGQGLADGLSKGTTSSTPPEVLP